jgi:hypothetical protein
VIKEGTTAVAVPALDLTQSIFTLMPVATNTFIIVIQLVLAALLLLPLSKRTMRVGALLSQ